MWGSGLEGTLIFRCHFWGLSSSFFFSVVVWGIDLVCYHSSTQSRNIQSRYFNQRTKAVRLHGHPLMSQNRGRNLVSETLEFALLLGVVVDRVLLLPISVCSGVFMLDTSAHFLVSLFRLMLPKIPKKLDAPLTNPLIKARIQILAEEIWSFT